MASRGVPLAARAESTKLGAALCFLEREASRPSFAPWRADGCVRDLHKSVAQLTTMRIARIRASRAGKVIERLGIRELRSLGGGWSPD